MSTAYHRTTVRVTEISTPDGLGIPLDSLWQKQNLIFRHGEEGRQVIGRLSRWARAEDAQGRFYLLWEAKHPRHQGLVIQPFDSCYCYEVFPEAASAAERGSRR